MTACAPTPPPIICSLSIWTRALSCHARSLSAWVFCSSRRIRTAVGMSSGLTAARSGAGAGGAALLSPGPASGPAGVASALAAAPGAPDGARAPALPPAFAADVLSVGRSLGFGPAATLAATSSDDSATTFDAARMRVLQPALAGDLVRRVQAGRAGCDLALYPVDCSSCNIAPRPSQAGEARLAAILPRSRSWWAHASLGLGWR